MPNSIMPYQPRFITAGRLREIIHDLEDNTPVLLPSQDHSYSPVGSISLTTALNKDGLWTEDYGEYTHEQDWGVRTNVLVIS